MVSIARGGARGRSKRQRDALVGLSLVLPATILLVVFFAVPLVLSAVMSLHNWPLFKSPTFVGLDNYLRVLQDEVVRNSFGFTVLYSVIITILSLAISFGLALLVQRGGLLMGFVRTTMLLPAAVGMALTGLLWGFLYNAQIGVFSSIAQALGLASGPVLFLDTPTSALWSVVVMVLWKSLGLNMLVMLVGLQSIPAELYEAARIDGASRRQQLTWVTLPLMRPTVALLLVLSVSGALLSFDQFFTLTAGGPDQSTITVVYAIYRVAFTSYQLGYAAALGVVLMALLVVVNLVQLRFLRQKEA